MIKKSLRIGRRDLQKIFRAKTRYLAGDFLYMRYLKNNLPFTRFAFPISVTAKKSAWARNLVRRRMSEAVRMLYGKLEKGWDIIIFAKIIKTNIPSYKLIENDIIKLLKNARVLQ